MEMGPPSVALSRYGTKPSSPRRLWMVLAAGFAPALATVSTSCLCCWTTRAGSGSADIPVCGFKELSSSLAKTGDWKVARTRRLESLRYNDELDPPAGAAPAGLLYKSNPQ